MTSYSHRQPGTLVLWLVGLVLVFCIGLTALLYGVEPLMALVPAIVALVMAAVAVLFGSLTVEVSDESLALCFGPGPIRKRFPLVEIRGVRAVRNRWYYGWGIRLTPHGWLFNVSGLDAVEVEMAGGRKYRIGTDEPRRLATAIETALRNHPG